MISQLTQLFLRVAVRRKTKLSVKRNSFVASHKLVRAGGGSISIGANSYFAGTMRFDRPDASLEVGDDSFVGASLFVSADAIRIGSHVQISWGVTVVDHNSHSLDWCRRKGEATAWLSGHKDWTDVAIAPVTIEDYVWIGFGATVLKGVKISEGAIVAANSVVTRDVPPYTVVAGNPAVVIRDLRGGQVAT